MDSTEIFLVDDTLNLEWKIIDFTEVIFPNGIFIMSGFPGYNKTRKFLELGNTTYLLDEWFKEKIFSSVVRYSTPISSKLSDRDRKDYFDDVTQNLFSSKKPCTAWFKVFLTNSQYELPSENSKTAIVTFYGGRVKGTVLQSYFDQTKKKY